MKNPMASKVFFKERIIADYNIGSPVHMSRTRVNWKELLKRILLLILAAIIVFIAGVEIHSYAKTPEITVSCSGGNWLLFYDENGVQIGTLRSASEEQFEQIKLIKKIKLDRSVANFVPSAKDAEYFELLNIKEYGKVCFDADECEYLPSEYNTTLTPAEDEQMLTQMSKETLFLHDELNYIILGEV